MTHRHGGEDDQRSPTRRTPPEFLRSGHCEFYQKTSGARLQSRQNVLSWGMLPLAIPMMENVR